MYQHHYYSITSLPYSNSKFDSFFNSQHPLAKEIVEGFDYVRDMNDIAKNSNMPHTLYIGEDILQVFSQDGKFDCVTKLDNSGKGTHFVSTLVNTEHKIDIKTYQFALTDNEQDGTVTVDYCKSNTFKDGSQRASIGTLTFNEQGLVSGLKSVVTYDNNGNVEKSQSVFEYQNEFGQICKEVLTAQDPAEITAEPNQVLAYRLDLLSHTPVASYGVDNQRANGDQVMEIMAQTQAQMLNLTSPEMVDMAVDFTLDQQ